MHTACQEQVQVIPKGRVETLVASHRRRSADAKFVVMHKGQVAAEIDSVFGSQQGDPLGGHYFALSIYDFAKQLKDTHPTACISWIVDDLTVTDTQGQLAEMAETIEVDGPGSAPLLSVTGHEV